MSPGNPVGLGNTRISTEYARKSPWTLSWSRLADFKSALSSKFQKVIGWFGCNGLIELTIINYIAAKVHRSSCLLKSCCLYLIYNSGRLHSLTNRLSSFVHTKHNAMFHNSGTWSKCGLAKYPCTKINMKTGIVWIGCHCLILIE